MKTIQSQLVPLWLSEDGGATFKQVVCLEQYGIPLETQTTETNTFCGVAVGLGTIRFNPTISAVCEASPTIDQVTYDRMVYWQKNKTLLKFKVQYPSPGSTNNNVFLSGDLYVTSTTLTAAIDDALKFTATFTGSGEIDIDPAP